MWWYVVVGKVSIDDAPINQQGAGPMNLGCQYSGVFKRWSTSKALGQWISGVFKMINEQGAGPMNLKCQYSGVFKRWSTSKALGQWISGVFKMINLQGAGPMNLGCQYSGVFKMINQQGAGPLNLKCQYSGNPPATVDWFKDNKPLGKPATSSSLH